MTTDLPPDDPRDYDECATCGAARWTHADATAAGLCAEFVELSQPTRMARVIEAAGILAHEFATFRASLQSTLRAVTGMHAAMKTAGLLPEGDQPDPHTSRGRHAVDMEAARQEAIERISGALDVPQALITGPGPDGIPDSWVTLAGRAAGKTSAMAESCPTCWPRPCDPSRALCRRNPDVTQTLPAVQDDDPNEPHLCDGCGRTDQAVTATDDGRALACPDCLPAANANIAADYCPDCGHPWAYSATGDCCMPVKPGTNTPAATPNEPTKRCGCPTTPPTTQPQTGLQSQPEQADPPA